MWLIGLQSGLKFFAERAKSLLCRTYSLTQTLNIRTHILYY